MLQGKNIYYKDRYYFPQLVDICVSNLILLAVSILLFVFFIIKGFPSIGSILGGFFSESFNLISVIAGLLLIFFLVTILLFAFWSFLIVLRTISYLLLSEPLFIYEEGIFLGKDKTILPGKLDRFLFECSNRFFLRKIPFFRAILNYPFFKIKNKNSLFLGFNDIKEISITKESVFRTILRSWWSPKDEVYYLKIMTTDGDVFEKEISNLYDFTKNNCLDFLSQKNQTSISMPWEIKNARLLKFEHIIDTITAIIFLTIMIFFILAYLEIYGGININPFL